MNKICINNYYSYELLRECINQFLVHLCFRLENRNEQFASYVKDLLKTALPQIDCKFRSTLVFYNTVIRKKNQ